MNNAEGGSMPEYEMHEESGPQGETPELDYDIFGRFIEDSFKNAKELQAKDHELFSTIPGPDGEEIELTPDNHTVTSTGQEGKYHLHLKEIKKGVAIAGGVLVTGAVLFKAAKSIRERRKK